VNKPEITRLWKLLTISDHVYYMATKFGSIGEVHSYFSPYKNANIAYGLFMEALGVLVEAVRREIEVNRKNVLSRLVLPGNKAFHFTLPTGEHTGLVAHSIREFIEVIDKVPPESLLYHFNKGDIDAWLLNLFGLRDIVEELRRLRENIASYGELVPTLKKLLLEIIE
jgi:alpha-amylase